MTQSLDEMIRACRQLGANDFAEKVAAKAAPEVEREIKKTASSGTSPDGKAWAPRKKDGGRAMANAADHIETKALRGAKIRTTLTGPDVFHHFATGKSEPRRQVIPDSKDLPEGVAKALTDSAAKVFDEITLGKEG